MIDKVVTAIYPLLDERSWIEQIGGITSPLTKTDIVEGKKISKTFPVAINRNPQECFNDNDIFMELMPNDKFKSVVFFEDLVGVLPDEKRKVTAKGRAYYGVIKMVAWLNLQKLGYDESTSISHLLVPDLIKHCLDCPQLLAIDDFAYGIKFEFLGEEPKQIERIFGKYSYAECASSFLYPYDFFAISIKVRWIMKKDCITSFTANNPIECMNIITN